MRVLVSTIGSRGYVQPVVGLALELLALGQEVRVCAPPDFHEFVVGFGIPFVPLGPELRKPVVVDPRRAVEESVATQFATIMEAAKGCDVVVAGGALQIAARSVSEVLGIQYVFASYCPITLPSAHHAPPPLPGRPTQGDNETLWGQDAQHWNDLFGPALNAHRAARGLDPVVNVRGHIFTEHPWLAADPTLGPWPGDGPVFQTGAWLVPDLRPLSLELEEFLAAGEPPVYAGLGSRMHVPDDLGQVIIKAARALGRRVIVSRGWAGLAPVDDGPDCISVGEVNQQALFRRVAAVVHHGGAGTTTAATRAGVPQVVLPQIYDQHYWAQRVEDLGIGSAHPPAAPTTDSLCTALERALRPELADRAHAISAAVRTDGAKVAAQWLVRDFG